jgi:hypothetical protein
MRDFTLSQQNDLVEDPSTLSAYLVFRRSKPNFLPVSITNDLSLAQSAWVDSSVVNGNVYRVTNKNDSLYLQTVAIVDNSWPAFVNQSIALKAGSWPAIDGQYVYYHKSNNDICRRSVLSWGSETVVRAGWSNPTTLIPLNDKLYGIWIPTYYYELVCLSGGESSRYTFYSQTTPAVPLRADGVSYEGKEYFYITDRPDGHVVEVVHVGNSVSGMDSWGVPTDVVPMDAIDTDFKFVLGGATVSGKIVVTGVLTRKSDAGETQMEVALVGPGGYSLGRDIIVGGVAGAFRYGKLLTVAGTDGNRTLVPGVSGYHISGPSSALGTHQTGGGTSDIGLVSITEAEDRSSTLKLEVPPDIDRSRLSLGNEVQVYAGYNGDTGMVGVFEVDGVNDLDTVDGESLSVSGTGKSSHLTRKWSPDYGIYIPGQARSYDNASSMTKLIRAAGKWESNTQSYALVGVHNDTSSLWRWVGTWGVDPAQGTPSSIHFSNTTGSYAEIKFNGTGFIFKFTKFTDRGIHDLYVDGVLVGSVNAYNGTKIQGSHTVTNLAPGPHTFKVIRGNPQSGYIDVDSIEITGSASGDVSYPTSLRLKDLNKLGVMYSTARASRGGSMVGKFRIPSGSNFQGSFGVAINYYMETATEAAARLGVETTELEDDSYGHNGIVAMYGPTERSGSEGISLKLWRDNTFILLNSALWLPSRDVWYWLEIYFVEGEIKVRYRADGTASWTEVFSERFNHSYLPWRRDFRGRGAILLKNITPTVKAYTFGAQDTTIGVEDFGALPTSGTLKIDNEFISYSGKSGNTLPSEGNMNLMGVSPFNLATDGDPGFTTGTRIIAGKESSGDGAWVGMGVGFIRVDHPNGVNNEYTVTHIPKTSRIVAFDHILPRRWGPYMGIVQGWTTGVGVSGQGEWINPAVDDDLAGYYLDNSPFDVVRVNDGFAAPYFHLTICRALYVTARGANGSSATSHPGSPFAYVLGGGTVWKNVITAHFEAGKYVEVAEAGFFSQDPDISLEDAVCRIGRYAGADFFTKPSLSGIGGASPWVTGTLLRKSNTIAELNLPTSIPLNGSVGFAFRSEAAFTNSAGRPVSNTGYSVSVRRPASGTTYYLTLKSVGADTTVEEIVFSPSSTGTSTYVPVGVLRVSVQDTFVSVWLNGRYIHTFCIEAGTGKNVAFFSSFASGWTFRISELDDLISDIIVGTRGNGFTVIGELLSDRRVHFIEDHYGRLYFYKSRTPLPIQALADCVYEVSENRNFGVTTRVRAEGLKISEVGNSDFFLEFGNVFETINARFANNIEETSAEAREHILETWRNSTVRTFGMVFHPSIQPGDVFDYGGDLRIVSSQQISLGLSEANLVCDTTCETIGYDPEV